MKITRLISESDFADYQPPKPTAQPFNGHHKQWVEACKTGSPTGTNFNYAGALTETVLLGVVAFRAGKKIEWDGPNMKVTNISEANRLLKTEYRKGWEV